MNIKNKIYDNLLKIKSINKKYRIFETSRSISYYYLSSIIPLTIFLITILNEFNVLNSNFVISKIFMIIIEVYGSIINSSKGIILITGINMVFLITIIYNFSKIINSLSKFTSSIYNIPRHRNTVHGLLNSGVFFMLSMFIIFSEVAISLYSHNKLIYYIDSKLLIGILEGIFEVLLFFIIIVILNVYLPPEKVYIKDVSKVSLVLSIIIYIILKIYVVLFDILYRKNEFVGIAFIISMIASLINFLNFIILMGIIINYKTIRKVNNINGGNK